MALPSPTSTWRAVKFLVRAGEMAIPAGLAWMADQISEDAEVSSLEWVRWQCIIGRSTPALTSEDKAQFKVDLLNITSGNVDTSWTAGDFANVKAKFDTFCTAMKAYTTDSHTFDSYRAYHMRFNPSPDITRPFADTGAPVYVATGVGNATGSIRLPYQVAATVTLRTAWAKHWGRIYLPGPFYTGGAVDANGRLPALYRTAVANLVFDLFDDLAAADFLPVVPVGQLEKQPFHALLGVSETVVDDIPDVQRRRRPKMAAARTIGIE